MSVFRVYPEKSNTICSGVYQNYNSGQNAITELWYGGGGTDTAPEKRNSISRFLVKFDLEDLQTKLNSNEINQDLVSSYKLVMKNSIPRDVALEPQYEYDVLNKSVAASFDLICFPINKDWDEGRGYDLIKENYLVKQKGNPLITGYSNWLSATSTVSWDEPGVYANPTASTSMYVTQNFPIGDEDIEFDVTTIMNDWLSGGSTNYGFCVAYRRDYELISSDTRYISSFLTEKTNTCYKPYLEVAYDQTIKDDRKHVTNNRSCKLFLYTFSAHSLVDIVLSAVTVDIKLGNTVVYSDLTPTQLSRGVYYVNVWMSAATEGQMYSDVWKSVQFNPPYDSQNITQKFQIQKNYYTNFLPKANNYIMDLYGLDNNAIITQEENIRVFCDLRAAFSLYAPTTPFELSYKMVLNNQIDVIDWSPVNRAVFEDCENYFFDLDSSWLLHNQTYIVYFKVTDLGGSRLMPEKLTFRVFKQF